MTQTGAVEASAPTMELLCGLTYVYALEHRAVGTAGQGIGLVAGARAAAYAACSC